MELEHNVVFFKTPAAAEAESKLKELFGADEELQSRLDKSFAEDKEKHVELFEEFSELNELFFADSGDGISKTAAYFAKNRRKSAECGADKLYEYAKQVRIRVDRETQTLHRLFGKIADIYRRSDLAGEVCVAAEQCGFISEPLESGYLEDDSKTVFLFFSDEFGYYNLEVFILAVFSEKDEVWYDKIVWFLKDAPDNDEKHELTAQAFDAAFGENFVVDDISFTKTSEDSASARAEKARRDYKRTVNGHL